jgi:hypothetical protein
MTFGVWNVGGLRGTDEQNTVAVYVMVIEFVKTRILYVILRDHWCDITVLNAYGTSEDESDARKDSFYEKLEHTFSHFSKYCMRMLLAHFKANVL